MKILSSCENFYHSETSPEELSHVQMNITPIMKIITMPEKDNHPLSF